MTISDITMKKFIADIKRQQVPYELKHLYQKLKIEAISTNRPIKVLTTIPVFRRLFSIAEITTIINHYRQEVKKEQLTIF